MCGIILCGIKKKDFVVSLVTIHFVFSYLVLLNGVLQTCPAYGGYTSQPRLCHGTYVLYGDMWHLEERDHLGYSMLQDKEILYNFIGIQFSSSKITAAG